MWVVFSGVVTCKAPVPRPMEYIQAQPTEADFELIREIDREIQREQREKRRKSCPHGPRRSNV